MKFVWLTIEGFRRFSTVSKINFDGKLIALVGPNESGKTSLLRALPFLNDSNLKFSKADFTRGKAIANDPTILKAEFILDSDDIASVSHVRGGSDIRWITFYVHYSGITKFQCNPEPTREPQHAKNVLRILESVWLRKWIDFKEENIDKPTISSRINNAVTALKESATEIENATLKRLDLIVQSLTDAAPKTIKKHLSRIARLLEEAVGLLKPDPHIEAINILHERRPRFLIFSEKDRDLNSDYALDKQTAQNPPNALKNLAHLGKLDLIELQSFIENGDQGSIESTLARTNEIFRTVMNESWSQSKLEVRIRVNGSELHVLVGRLDTGYETIADRSDGLRQFVALIAFLNHKELMNRSLILLIDEVENHLHYDAQADVLQMLSKQNLVLKVIYSTHSIGALPEDLGAGIRLIIPTEDSNTSVVNNWFWNNDTPGFSPLLFGMGARTMAFIPVRNALIAEGSSDFILLPSMFREAIESSSIGFQVAPGISNADSEEIALLDSSASRVVYIVDSDEGGLRIKKKLVKAGISEDRVFPLENTSAATGLVLEDLLNKTQYLMALNSEFHRSGQTEYKLVEDDFGDLGRPKAIEMWCQKRGINVPTKRAIACAVLEQATLSRMPLLSPKGSRTLKNLHEKIIRRLSTN